MCQQTSNCSAFNYNEESKLCRQGQKGKGINSTNANALTVYEKPGKKICFLSLPSSFFSSAFLWYFSLWLDRLSSGVASDTLLGPAM